MSVSSLQFSNTTTRTDSLVHERICFLFCPTGTYCREDRCQSYFKFELIPSLRAPLEECESAGAISKIGGKAFLIDAPAERLSDEQFTKRVRQVAADLLVIVTTFGSLDLDLSWAKTLRDDFPQTKICLRGAPCYVYSAEILRKAPFVDFCIRGEYELVFNDILRKGYEQATGVIYHEEGKIKYAAGQSALKLPLAENLDELPFPDRSIIKQELYKVRGFRKSQATIRVQRGCPYSCTYCLVHLVSGKKARHRSAKNIVQEMQQLISQGINYFYLRADTFTLDKDWVLKLCAQIKAECPSAKWVTTTRIDRVDSDIIAAMKAAGCYGISFGIDVGSEEIAQKVNKQANLEQADLAMKLCDRFGIISLAYIMIGFIWDTAKTLQQTEDFIRRIKPDLLTVHFAHPYPGTVYFQQIQEYKEALKFKSINNIEAQSAPAIQTNQFTEHDLLVCSRRMLKKHYLRLGVIVSIIKKIIGHKLNS